MAPSCLSCGSAAMADITTEIKRLSETQDGILALVQPFDFLCLLRPETVATLTGTDRRIADALAKGPLSPASIGAGAGGFPSGAARYAM